MACGEASPTQHGLDAYPLNLAYVIKNVLDAMRQDAEIEGMPLLRVDGGATKSDLLMQIQVRGVGDATCADPSWCRSEYAEWHPVRWERPVCHA
eukprot:1156619-Pelagomonas_calceolata.AAC.3